MQPSVSGSKAPQAFVGPNAQQQQQPFPGSHTVQGPPSPGSRITEPSHLKPISSALARTDSNQHPQHRPGFAHTMQNGSGYYPPTHEFRPPFPYHPTYPNKMMRQEQVREDMPNGTGQEGKSTMAPPDLKIARNPDGAGIESRLFVPEPGSDATSGRWLPVQERALVGRTENAVDNNLSQMPNITLWESSHQQATNLASTQNDLSLPKRPGPDSYEGEIGNYAGDPDEEQYEENDEENEEQLGDDYDEDGESEENEGSEYPQGNPAMGFPFVHPHALNYYRMGPPHARPQNNTHPNVPIYPPPPRGSHVGYPISMMPHLPSPPPPYHMSHMPPPPHTHHRMQGPNTRDKKWPPSAEEYQDVKDYPHDFPGQAKVANLAHSKPSANVNEIHHFGHGPPRSTAWEASSPGAHGRPFPPSRVPLSPGPHSIGHFPQPHFRMNVAPPYPPHYGLVFGNGSPPMGRVHPQPPPPPIHQQIGSGPMPLFASPPGVANGWGTKNGQGYRSRNNYPHSEPINRIPMNHPHNPASPHFPGSPSSHHPSPHALQAHRAPVLAPSNAPNSNFQKNNHPQSHFHPRHQNANTLKSELPGNSMHRDRFAAPESELNGIRNIPETATQVNPGQSEDVKGSKRELLDHAVPNSDAAADEEEGQREETGAMVEQEKVQGKGIPGVQKEENHASKLHQGERPVSEREDEISGRRDAPVMLEKKIPFTNLISEGEQRRLLEQQFKDLLSIPDIPGKYLNQDEKPSERLPDTSQKTKEETRLTTNPRRFEDIGTAKISGVRGTAENDVRSLSSENSINPRSHARGPMRRGIKVESVFRQGDEEISAAGKNERAIGKTDKELNKENARRNSLQRTRGPLPRGPHVSRGRRMLMFMEKFSNQLDANPPSDKTSQQAVE